MKQERKPKKNYWWQDLKTIEGDVKSYYIDEQNKKKFIKNASVAE